MDIILFKMYLLEARDRKAGLSTLDTIPLELAIKCDRNMNNPQHLVDDFLHLSVPPGFKIRVERTGAIKHNIISPFGINESLKALGYEAVEDAVYQSNNHPYGMPLFEEDRANFESKKYFISSDSELHYLTRAIWKLFGAQGISIETFSEPASYYLGE